VIWNRDAESMPRGQLRALQLERLRQLLDRVYRRVPFYRRMLDEAGLTPDSVCGLDDLQRLPFTRKTDLRENYPDRLFAEPMDQMVRIHASSGTKGKPTVVGYTREDVATWSEVMARCLAAGGVGPHDVAQVAYGYGLFTGGLGFHYGAELLGCTVIPVSGGMTPRQVLLMQDLGSTVLCCTPSYALNIAEYLLAKKVPRETLRLRVGFFGAEPWTEPMRAEIERSLELVALDVYGLSEIIGPGVAYECLEAKNGAHLCEDHFLPEIVDPDSGVQLAEGQEGELVLTTLTKQGMPLVRYRTGDISSLSTEPCVCGRTTARMTRVRGRCDDMLIIRGINLYSSEVERVLLTAAELAPHYQLVVSRRGALDSLEVRAEISEAYAAGLGTWEADSCPSTILDLQERLERRFREQLGLGMAVRLCPPGSLPRSEGKAVRVIDQRGL
jgi:phenylacetate-CoA ligase